MSEQLISILYYNVIDICHINKYSHDDIINCITNIVRKLSNDQKKKLLSKYEIPYMKFCPVNIDINIPILCYGNYRINENTYLYHGSPILFTSPYQLKNLDNRLSPSINIPILYATKRSGVGFIYEYKATKNTLQNGGILNILFAYGNFSKIQDQLEEQIIKLCLKYNCFHKAEMNEIFEERTNYSGYDKIISSLCFTPFNGLFIPKYENQLILCNKKNNKFLEINNIYFVSKEDKTKNKINIKLSKGTHIVLENGTIININNL
jgi:hypothetical protein